MTPPAVDGKSFAARRHEFLPARIEPLLPGAGGGRRWRDHRQVIKAYSHPSTRRALRTRGIALTCPERADQIAQRKTKGTSGGRPPGFDPEIYRGRNVVERCFGRLKQFRGLATRFAKRVAYYRTEVIIATIAIWLRDLQDRP
jgi:transposase